VSQRHHQKYQARVRLAGEPPGYNLTLLPLLPSLGTIFNYLLLIITVSTDSTVVMGVSFKFYCHPLTFAIDMRCMKDRQVLQIMHIMSSTSPKYVNEIIWQIDLVQEVCDLKLLQIADFIESMMSGFPTGDFHIRIFS
jgi:type IV secretory pathway VirB3-like protein